MRSIDEKALHRNLERTEYYVDSAKCLLHLKDDKFENGSRTSICSFVAHLYSLKCLSFKTLAVHLKMKKILLFGESPLSVLI